MSISPSMEITCRELATRMNDSQQTNPRLVDCREADELEICHIDDADHCPLSEWAEKWQEWFPDKNQEIVVLCHHGMRSLKATLFLRQRGYGNTYSMAGGIDIWAEKIDESMPRY